MAIPPQPIKLSIQYMQFETSWRLLQRMYVGEERKLSRMVFGTTPRPMPPLFQDPNHPLAIQLNSIVEKTLILETTDTLFEEWGLASHEIDQLQMDDPRIAALRQRLTGEIKLIPLVQQLRATYVQLINNDLYV